MRVVPVEMLESARPMLATGEESLPQLVYTSLLFGASGVEDGRLRELGGSTVRRHTLISVDRAVSTTRGRWSAALRKPVVAALALRGPRREPESA